MAGLKHAINAGSTFCGAQQPDLLFHDTCPVFRINVVLVHGAGRAAEDSLLESSQ